MRALTDRELDAVCGGGFSISFSQSIWNKQTTSSSVSQSNSWSWGGSNTSTVNQQNNATNLNSLVISF
jgi:hypothetical protein